jgi:hypothetical protein
MFSTRIVLPLAKATVEQCDNFVRRQHRTLSLEADVLCRPLLSKSPLVSTS